MPDYRSCESLEEVQQLVDHFSTSDVPYVAFDVETGYTGQTRKSGSLRAYHDGFHIVGISLANHVDWARYIPLNHTFADNLPEWEVWELLKPLFESKTILAHNLAFDMRAVQSLYLKEEGPEINFNKFEDTMLQSYVLAQTKTHGLKFLTKHYFDYDQSSLKELFPDQESWTYEETKKLRFSGLPLAPHVIRYVCDDARWVIGLYELFTEELNKPENYRLKFIYGMEKEILGILGDMQNTGVAFDWDKFDEDWMNGRYMEDSLRSEVRKRFADDLGIKEFDHALNFNSSHQMRKLLYGDLKLTTTRMTDSGAMSTDELALLGLADQSTGAAKLSEYKRFMKNLGFYKTWDEFRESYDRRIHSDTSQIHVQSGRFASSNPNQQNIKKEFWFQVPDGEKAQLKESGTNGWDYWSGSHRSYIIPSKGYTLFSFDYSQGELRVLAGVAGEKYLRNAYRDGVDVHTTTASLMLGVPLDEVTKDQRATGKTMNFAILYGSGPKLIGENLNIPYDDAVELVDRYLSAYSSVKRWIKSQQETGQALGMVETFMGRKVTLWDLESEDDYVRSKADRLAVNSPIQGGLADIVKVGMIKTSRALQQKGWWNDKVRLLMNQHDSLVFEVHHSLDLGDVYDTIQPMVQFNPTGTYKLRQVDGRDKEFYFQFPDFVTDWEYGQNWGTMEAFTR